MSNSISKCLFCESSELDVSVETISGEEVGLPGLTLECTPVIHCQNCGESFYSLPPHGVLLSNTSRTLARSKGDLSSSDFSTIRKVLGFSGKSFADLIGVSNVSVSRWENGSVVVPRHVSTLVRLLALISADLRKALLQIIQNPTGAKPKIDCSSVVKTPAADFQFRFDVNRSRILRTADVDSANDSSYDWYPPTRAVPGRKVACQAR